MTSYVSRELILCAFVWLDPGITPCCKTILRPRREEQFFSIKFEWRNLIHKSGFSESDIARFLGSDEEPTTFATQSLR